MSITAPHYLLLSETHSDQSNLAGGWSFVLERIDGAGRIEVADQEPDVRGERLKLLAVVRGLEAIEEPSQVTLITPHRFIGRGIRKGLSAWKENDWQWERFGAMTEIKNADLWRRIDRAKAIHTIDCRVWNFSKYMEKVLRIESTHRSAAQGSRNRITISNATQTDDAAEIFNEQFARTSPAGKFQLSSWIELAATLANRIIPVSPQQQVYGCA